MSARLKRPALLVGLVAVLIVASFLLGRSFSRPEWQEVAEQAEAVDVWAPVEERVVNDSLQLTGAVEAAETESLSPTELPTPAVVTVPPPSGGSRVGPGAFVGEISGRPYFILAPPLALYRDLRAGDQGADVASLQASLTASGLKVAKTGTVDEETLAAVGKLFEDAGKALPGVETAAEGAGAYIPYAQLLPSSGGPITSSAALGARIDSEHPLLRIEVAPKSIRAFAAPDQVGALTTGTVLHGEVGDSTIEATVAAVGDFQEEEGGKLPGHPVRIETEPGALEDLSVGQSIVLSTSTSDAAPGPSVPLTAIRTDQAGTYVIVKAGQASTRQSVTVLRRAGGWAAVSGVESGAEVKVS